MAKRKRLSPAQDDYLVSEGPRLETKSMPLGPEARRAPIAQVAGEASASAALAELAGELKTAREEGRLIQTLDAAQIDAGYLVRDRLVADDDELQALMASLRARGQQTPVEVVALPDGHFGLISGWRRLTALQRLHEETGDDRFARVLAILRRPDTAAAAYVAMVEENEIRVGLSYYERARVAAKAVEQGVFETEKAALLELYAAASRPKRSKIRSFLALYHAADDLLQFPSAIGERLGLAVAKALDGMKVKAAKLRHILTHGRADSVEAEQALLQAFVKEMEFLSLTVGSETKSGAKSEPRPGAKAGSTSPAAAAGEEVAPGVSARWDGRRLTLSGPGLSEELRAALLDWLRQRR